ncbi:hypothetical protein [Prevotella sp.]|uniref:hypothetical protein n=1 Tax=Prevotella sp. TaxID=59823 RepID=UPI0027E32E74|nr:hypothetical protein [Prevotella sp.]
MHVTEPFVIIAQFISGSNNDGLPALTLADHFYLITKAMNKYLRKVLEMLKTNKDIKALGFSRRELKGIAANVADKLKLEEDATDEDVSEAISSAIDDVLPLLKLTQSAVDRQVQDYKRSTEDDDDDDDDDDKKEPNRRNPSQKNPKSKKDSDVADSATLAALKELTQVVTALQGEVNTLKTGNTTNSRRAKVEKLLTDTGKFGERQLRAFSRMSFKDEEEFEEYLEDLKEDIEADNQERADRGLGKLGNIPAPDKNQNNNEEELMSDEDVKKLAQM